MLIIKVNEMHYFLTLFRKELYMFRADLLSNIRILNTVYIVHSPTIALFIKLGEA